MEILSAADNGRAGSFEGRGDSAGSSSSLILDIIKMVATRAEVAVNLGPVFIDHYDGPAGWTGHDGPTLCLEVIVGAAG